MGGLGHDFKAGVNFINEPRLFITFNTGKGAIFNTHLTNDANGAIQTVTVSDGDSSANIPTKQFGTYIQDDWRPNSRLTVNLGLRWDFVTGYQFDQSKNPNYVAIVNAAKAGLLNGIVGLENFALSPGERQGQLPAAHRRGVRRSRQRQGRDPRRLGHLHRLRLHQLQRPVRGG